MKTKERCVRVVSKWDICSPLFASILWRSLNNIQLKKGVSKETNNNQQLVVYRESGGKVGKKKREITNGTTNWSQTRIYTHIWPDGTKVTSDCSRPYSKHNVSYNKSGLSLVSISAFKPFCSACTCFLLTLFAYTLGFQFHFRQLFE